MSERATAAWQKKAYVIDDADCVQYLKRLPVTRGASAKRPQKEQRFMSSKDRIRYQAKEDDQPGWDLYAEIFEPEDVVYLELDGVAAEVTMLGNLERGPGTVLLRLPVATAKQLGLVPPGWKKSGWERE
ncbi:hypothetical protein [Paraburkholderia sp. BL10I2N1]|uniref:hypothetical protein n=1 Tax=Paraburkholderia sp. BL10I2N1 TaxID=1938796 RepID=UPI0010E4765E|nr:hypothetical protein [Paraburkholderia sp. BL10I2N1]TDN63957.1 hypothetical protein B0G77_7650 [Paraburkholderia sp. BL10I2N1]